MNRKKNFICLFPLGENVHLVKDVGQVPYWLQKNGYYNSFVSFYEDENKLPYLKTEVKGLNYVKMKKVFKSDNINMLLFFLTHLSKFDILMFFHVDKFKLALVLLMKVISLNRVQIYIKMDLDERFLTKEIPKKGLLFLFFKYLCSKIDLFTVETKLLHQFINSSTFIQAELMPNGVDNEYFTDDVSKEEVFLSVGRLGSFEKGTDILLKALDGIDLKNWTFKLVGPIAHDFMPVIDAFFINNPHLIDKVIFTGNISDRSLLKELYREASVFVLPSRSESFGLVLVEAMANGCYVLATELNATNDITNNGRWGLLVSKNDFVGLRQALDKIVSLKCAIPDPKEIIEYAKFNYKWGSNVRIIFDKLG